MLWEHIATQVGDITKEQYDEAVREAKADTHVYIEEILDSDEERQNLEFAKMIRESAAENRKLTGE